MANTATVTGASGPGLSLTAAVFNSVTDVDFQMDNNILRLVSNNGISYVDISAATTITMTKSSSLYTVTVS